MSPQTPAILPSLDDGGEYESDEFPELTPDLTALTDIVYTRTRKRIVSCQKTTRGTYHEIYILNTADDQKLIARLSRRPRNPATLRSEVATMDLVRTRTSIPVPTVHLFIDSPSNDVGVQFIVMDYIEGVSLYKIWDDLTLDQKKGVLSQIARVLGQLASMEFDAIGSIMDDGSVGPLLYSTMDEEAGMFNGPFRSTSDYLSHFIDRYSRTGGDESHIHLSNTRTVLTKYLASRGEELYIRPPFRLQHLISMAKISASLTPHLVMAVPLQSSRDYAHTPPLYFLYEYPIFIQDVHWSENLYEENAILRQYFVQALRQQFPRDSVHYGEARTCIPSGKCGTLNRFSDIFMKGERNESLLPVVGYYVQEEEEGTGTAYPGRLDWAPDPDPDDLPECVQYD